MYWPADDEWYHGEVKDVDDCGRSHVKYDDGQVEILYFAVERYKLATQVLSSLLPCFTYAILLAVLLCFCQSMLFVVQHDLCSCRNC